MNSTAYIILRRFLNGGFVMAVQLRTKAPEFALEGVVKGEIKKVSSSDFKGKWLVLGFYPLDFTPV